MQYFHFIMKVQIKSLIVLLATIMAVFVFNPPHLMGQSLSGHVVKKNITPKNSQHLLGYGARKSTGVHDSIYHKILVLDDGETTFVLVSSDICLVSPAEYDRVKALVANEMDISPDQFYWSVTHTHSAPEVGPPGLPELFLGDRYTHSFDTAYTNFVTRQLLDGVVEAKLGLKPARLGVGWGHSNANINRRAVDEKGVVRLGMNPDGPVDRRIGVLKLTDAHSGNLMATIANYAIHGTVMSGHNLDISGDAPGIVATYVEEKTGAPLLFINGAAGNIAPIYSVYPSPSAGHLNEFKVLLGDKILDAVNRINGFETDIKFQFGKEILRTPRKETLGWTEALSDYTSTPQSGKPEVLLPVYFLKINPRIAIWAAPLELFCESSNAIRSQSPFEFTFYYGYTNGWLGYLLTKEEYHKGGYEVSVSPYTSAADKQLRKTVTAYLQGELSGQ